MSDQRPPVADLAGRITENIRKERDALRVERMELLHDLDQYRAIVRDKDDEAAAMRRWLIRHGLLVFLDAAHRPDKTHGPTWILRKPHSIAADSCEGWSAESADAAIEDAMVEVNEAWARAQQEQQK